MIGNKVQPYTYTLKTAAVAGGYFCGNKFYLYLTPPENALSLENLKTHIRIKFNTSVPVAFRKVLRVGIQNALDGLEYSTHKRSIELNVAADANRIVDLKLDLSSLIKKSNVEFWSGNASDYPNLTNYIFIEVPIEVYDYWVAPDYNRTGDIQLWKADGLFTINEIR